MSKYLCCSPVLFSAAEADRGSHEDPLYAELCNVGSRQIYLPGRTSGGAARRSLDAFCDFAFILHLWKNAEGCEEGRGGDLRELSIESGIVTADLATPSWGATTRHAPFSAGRSRLWRSWTNGRTGLPCHASSKVNPPTKTLWRMAAKTSDTTFRST